MCNDYIRSFYSIFYCGQYILFVECTFKLASVVTPFCMHRKYTYVKSLLSGAMYVCCALRPPYILLWVSSSSPYLTVSAHLLHRHQKSHRNVVISSLEEAFMTASGSMPPDDDGVGIILTQFDDGGIGFVSNLLFVKSPSGEGWSYSNTTPIIIVAMPPLGILF